MSSEKKNERVAAAQLKATELTADKATARKLNGKNADKQDPARLLTIASQAAQHNTHTRNWKFKNADLHFPHEPLLRRVDKHFPYAKGGPLFVDEPTSELETKGCVRKAAVMAKEGLRYCYITKEMKLADVLKQLEPSRKAS